MLQSVCTVRARFSRLITTLNGRQRRRYCTGGDRGDKTGDEDREESEAGKDSTKTVAGYTFDELLDRIARAQLRKDEKILEQPTEKRRGKTRHSSTPLNNVEQLVEFLKAEDARDVCVIRVPPEREYVEYFVVCSGVGTRHIRSMADNLATEVRWYVGGSRERVRVEGKDSEEWMAVDLGFAVVHMMLDKVRKRYELEKLWTLGPKFDDQTVAMHENSDT